MSQLDCEIERLKEEIKEETLKRDALEQSVHDGESNIGELQKKLVEEYQDDDSTNNWKQKYEKQSEKNTYLEHELSLMKEKMEALSKLIDDSPLSKKTDQPDIDLRHLLRQLEHEKCSLENKLKDSEWRLDSESKELFKLAEKKREMQLKLNQGFQLATGLSKKPDWIKNRYQGVPDNHRIIDPRKGPIKKDACVKPLPKITTEEANAVLSATKQQKSPKKSPGGKAKTDSYSNIRKHNRKNEVAKDNEKLDIMKSGKDQVVVKSADDQDIVKSGDDQDVVKSGDNKDVVKSGDNKDVVKTGDDQDVVKNGDNQDIVKSGSNKDVVKNEKNQDVVKIGKNQDIAKNGGNHDIADSGDNQDVMKSESKQNAVKNGDNQDITKNGDNQDIVKSGDNQDRVKNGKNRGLVENGENVNVKKNVKSRDKENIEKSNSTKDVNKKKVSNKKLPVSETTEK